MLLFRSIRSISNKYPRLSNAIGCSALYMGGMGGTVYLTNHVTKQIKDPKEAQIIWDHLLDVDGCKQALAKYHREREKTTKPP